jgi:carboxyl-terminal processing protease
VQAVLNLNKNIRSSYSKEISDVGQLNVTVQKFYRITGGSTQLKGVVPDIILPSLFQHLKSGEKYLDYTLPWDQISLVKYSSFRGQPIDIDMVRKKSLQRVKHDPGLRAITDEAAKADKRSKQTVVSLKLADMRRNFDETREERKIFNSQFINHKIGQHNDDQSEIDREGINNEGSNWKELIKKDPYIGEAKNIIADMER